MADWSFYDRGFSVFPLIPNTKRPAGKWKSYITQRAEPQAIERWRREPNMGVATGAVSGCIVLDCDDLEARCEAEARGVPLTLTVQTPRGTHFYFRHPGWPISNKAGMEWCKRDKLGWDLRADGGFVVGPGSYYQPNEAELFKGKVAGHYTIELDAPLADAPDWLLELLVPKKTTNIIAPFRLAEETSAYGRGALARVLPDLAECPQGARNDKIFWTARRVAELVAGGEILQEEGWEGLYESLTALGLRDEAAANDVLARGWARGMSEPKCAPERMPIDPALALGERQAIAPPPPADPNAPPSFGPVIKPKLVTSENFREYFKGCVYIANRDQMFLPAGVLAGRSAFDGLYAGSKFVTDIEGSKPEKSAWLAFRQVNYLEMPTAWDICFRPELPPGEIVRIEGYPYLNIYVPIQTPRMAGDASPFVNHVRRMLPNGNDAEYLLQWMASCVQNPGAKFQWWPVIQGTKGNGKSLLLRVMVQAIGERYSHYVRSDALLKTGNQFNDWIVGKLFLGFEEIQSAEGKRDFVEMMKDTVTNERLATEGKGKGQATSDNRANGMMLTNHKGACPIDDDERRWGIFFCAQQSEEDLQRDGMTGTYFHQLYDWLRADGYAIVTHYLATLPLAADLNPAQGLQRAPTTTSTQEAVIESRGLLEQEILEAIETGQPGFRGGVITSLTLRSLFDRLRKTVGPRRFRSIMTNIGYVTHPALEANKGRPNNPLSDGTRPVLYFEKNHAILAHQSAPDVIEMVEKIIKGEQISGSNVIPFHR